MSLLEEAFYAASGLVRTKAGSRIDRALRREIRDLSLRRLPVSGLDDPDLVDDLVRASIWSRSGSARPDRGCVDPEWNDLTPS
jgi:hypothetical protein